MTDQSQFDGNVAPPFRPRKSGLIAALVLGLILGAGLMGLWGIYGSAPLSQPQPGVAANAPNETAEAIKDLQTTEQKIVGQLQSVQQTLASEQAETKRLSDQITTLNGKLDALQQSFASAQQQSSAAPSAPPPAPAKRRR
jgi:peptidoglycan hydrolase CwlO-like protein